tara:strand:- start:547 stop:1098 length:552 start_codon:yes stop_codon:yes gene_type:complete
MARTPSNMVTLGTLAPEFTLLNTINDRLYSSEKLFNKNGAVIMFICNHCPFVIHIINEIVSISENYKENISFVAISSNDVINYPEDSPKLMKKLALHKNFSFPYLYDETQEVAKSFDAACTPDFFLYNDKKKLVYRGQMDDSRPGNGIPVTGNDLKVALENLIKNKEISNEQKPSIGCNIKWK